jgi:hypothetical protein
MKTPTITPSNYQLNLDRMWELWEKKNSQEENEEFIGLTELLSDYEEKEYPIVMSEDISYRSLRYSRKNQ